jgi:hypothetical protein
MLPWPLFLRLPGSDCPVRFRRSLARVLSVKKNFAQSASAIRALRKLIRVSAVGVRPSA